MKNPSPGDSLIAERLSTQFWTLNVIVSAGFNISRTLGGALVIQTLHEDAVKVPPTDLNSQLHLDPLQPYQPRLGSPERTRTGKPEETVSYLKEPCGLLAGVVCLEGGVMVPSSCSLSVSLGHSLSGVVAPLPRLVGWLPSDSIRELGSWSPYSKLAWCAMLPAVTLDTNTPPFSPLTMEMPSGSAPFWTMTLRGSSKYGLQGDKRGCFTIDDTGGDPRRLQHATLII
ncbi:hypothetical protein EYF80_041675 [Liparis tanakae]|uniref:Uncharacterized protein n=1 Tax=Liparis tanakae TaxID=230148 RepID=A0A4Z2G5Q7_9TELE|nr:hypothetical protein EYF80_041675 [Liparis tanakae]